jgi:hypothetical protein
MSQRGHIEHAETLTAIHEKPTRFFFHRKRRDGLKGSEKNGTDSDATEIDAPSSEKISPVGLTKLFRYVRDDQLSAIYLLIALLQL